MNTQIQKVDERLALYRKEMETIHDSFVSDSTAWSRERNDRYEELGNLVAQEEEAWLQLHQKVEQLDALLAKG